MSPAEREFDVVLYGATGFTGKLTAEYLARRGGGARIALAGRSTQRLQAVQQTLGPAAQDWPLIVADASEPSTLEAMANRTQVVVTAVGPYAIHGLPMVAACAKTGTDYADVNGELMFARNAIDQFHKQAVDTGARIVLSCGFDSIPSDLNVYSIYRRALEEGTGELRDTHNVLLSVLMGRGSGSSIASYLEVMRAASSDPDVRRQINEPYTLSSDRGAEPEFGAQPDFRIRRGRDLAPELTRFWLGGFLLAPHNARIVRRSNSLQDWAYGRGFRYTEGMSLGKSFAAPLFAAGMTGTVAGVVGLGNKFLHRVPRSLERPFTKSHSGPPARFRERGHYTFETYAATSTGARYKATFGQKGDGYVGTAVLLGESGLALALDRDRLSDLRGVLTPAAAMGDVLLARLPKAGVTMGTTRLS